MATPDDTASLICTKCGLHPSISRKDRRCKVCVAERQHAWNERNKEHIRQKNAERYKQNSDRIRARVSEYQKGHTAERAIAQRKHYEANRETILAVNTEYRKAHVEEIKVTAKAWLECNKDKRSAYQKEYSRKNSQRIVTRAIEYKKSHPEKARKWNQVYQQNHPETGRATQAKRRAQIANAIVDAAEVSAFYRYVQQAKSIECRWCKASVPRSARHVDHIIPVSKGGAHARYNLCCACARCNLSKGAKMPEDFKRQAFLRF